jgi:hypothetical protein
VLILKIVMPLNVDWPKSLKTPADTADNTAINCVVRSDELPVSVRRIDASTRGCLEHVHNRISGDKPSDRGSIRAMAIFTT